MCRWGCEGGDVEMGTWRWALEVMLWGQLWARDNSMYVFYKHPRTCIHLAIPHMQTRSHVLTPRAPTHCSLCWEHG